eukprot:906538-Ditylum_brightwellii.AAC.1
MSQLIGIFKSWLSTSTAITKVSCASNKHFKNILLAFKAEPELLYYYRVEYEKHLKLKTAMDPPR